MNQEKRLPSSVSSVDPYFEELQSRTKFSFDFILWAYRILKYWYLFVISIIIFVGYAYVKNLSWVPYYRTSAMLMLEPRGNMGVAMGSVQLGGLVRNYTNQQMILTSYDMVVRTVDRLPEMRVDYFKSTKFYTVNLFGKTPITISAQYISQAAYGLVFTIEPINSERCRIFYEATEDTPGFSMEVPYGEYVQEHRFYIKIDKLENFSADGQFEPFEFRFVSKDELVGRYNGRVSAGFRSEGSSVLIVNITGANPIQDKVYLNALFDEYLANNLALKNEAADRSIDFISKQLAIITDSLNNSEYAFRDFQEKTGMYKLESDQINTAYLAQISEDLGKLRADENLLLLISEDINKSILEEQELTIKIPEDLSAGGLSGQIDSYNELLRSHKAMGEGHPFYAKSEKALTATRIKILEELKKVQEKMQSRKEDLQSKEKDVEARLMVLPTQEREYLRYERDYQINVKYHTYLTQKKQEVNIEKASNIPDNYVLEEPRQAGGPVNGDEKSSRYTFFFLLGVALPLGFIILKEEVFNFTVSTKDECEKISGLPVIGAIENVSKKKQKNSSGIVLVKNYPKSSFAESFRNIRIRLEYMAQKETGISVLLTSAEPGDGKTFIAANIASVYQLTGKKVVLVDFDLRRPSVAKTLGITMKKGVSNFLIGQVSLDEIVMTHPDFGFDVIPAGTLPPNPSELIKTKRTRDLLDYLKTKYDYVIVDCSPVGLVSDAYILSEQVDTTLFVVRRAKTNKSFFKSVIQQIRGDEMRSVAIIFNDVKGREGYYGTSRYYGDRNYYLKRNSYYHDDYFEK